MGFLSDIKDAVLGSKPSADISQHGTLTPEQSNALRILLDRLLTGNSNSLQAGVDRFSGDTNVEQSPIVDQILADMQNGQGLFGDVTNALSSILTAGPTDISSIFESSIRDPLIKTFNEDILPGVDRRFASSGFFSTDRNKAVSDATDNLTDTLASELSKLVFQTTESDKNRKIQGANTASNVISSAAGIGSQDTALRERNADRDFRNFQFDQQQESNIINQLLAAIGAKGVENIAVVKPGQEGILSSIAKGVGQTVGKQGGSKIF